MIPTLIIDSTNCPTDLCFIGGIFGADKSPFNGGGHRHPYTPVYSLLLSQYRTRPVRFAEIGVAGGASVLMWNKYFENGTFYFFDRDQNFLDNSKRLTGANSTFILMDVIQEESVNSALDLTGGNLDVLLDDSSHNPNDQKRIIHQGLKYLRSGGTIIIEDVDRKEPESSYEDILKDIRGEFSFISFIITEHTNKYSPGWDNDKLLVLVKK